MTKQETVAEVLAEMHVPHVLHYIKNKPLENYIARIQAAHDREVKALQAHIDELMPEGLEKFSAELGSLAALPKQGWLPIETAPKDGARVILAWGGKSVPALWLDNSTKTISWAGWRTPSLEPVPNGSPTHWQPFPLPPPPEGET